MDHSSGGKHQLILLHLKRSLMLTYQRSIQTRVSMTPTRNSYDIRFFPEPCKFNPGRWLQEEETVANMQRVFMPFAAGRRGCLGMQ